ncbi:MAG: DUF1992 domain-containing protein [Ardenticatenaceae bacterium]|nr:DUF1992 domain-containing protein [Ardenticatenaceae bacterium]
MSFDIEEQIRDAQDAGHFNNLPGVGKPLNLTRNPFAQQEQLAHDILQSNGYTLPWVEEKRSIEAQINKATQQLKRTWVRYDGSREAAYSWRAAKQVYREAIGGINKRIRSFNLKAPNPHFHLLAIDPEANIRDIQEF